MIRLSVDQQVELMDREGLARFSALWTLGEKARYASRDVLSDEYDDAISAMLEGHDDALRAEIVQTVAGRMPLMDRVTAELCAHGCCDPLTALALAIALEETAVIEDAATDETVILVDEANASDSDHCSTVTWVATGVQWTATGRLLLDDVHPDSTLVSATGRPLREFLVHPVLDRHPLVVVGIEDGHGGRVSLITDADRTALAADEIAGIRPPAAAR